MTICQRPRTQLLLISYVSMCAASLGLKEQNKWMWTHTPLPRGSRHRSPSGNSTGGCDAQGTLYKQSFEGPPFVPVLCNVGPWSVGPRRCGVRWQRGGGGQTSMLLLRGSEEGTPGQFKRKPAMQCPQLLTHSSGGAASLTAPTHPTKNATDDGVGLRRLRILGDRQYGAKRRTTRPI